MIDCIFERPSHFHISDSGRFHNKEDDEEGDSNEQEDHCNERDDVVLVIFVEELLHDLNIILFDFHIYISSNI